MKKSPSTLETTIRRHINPRWISTAICCSLVSLFGLASQAATIVWSGASGTDTNWSTGANWSGAVAPGGSDDVKFYDAGTNLTTGLPNSLVDAAFGGYVGSLQFGQTNGLHTVFIPAGQTLNVTNGNLVVGTPGDVGVAKNFTNTIAGAGATLNINNTNSSLVLNQGTATSVTGTRANLDLSALDTFLMNGSRIGLGTTTLPNPNSANQREAGLLLLARTNVIRLSLAAPLYTYLTTAAQSAAIEMSHNQGNNAGIQSFLYLGVTNVFYVDSISAGRTKASAGSAATIQFNPAFLASSPAAYFRGIGGDSSRVTWWSIADMCTAASSSQVSVGTNNFTGGTVDALVETLSIARDTTASHTASANIIGVLTFNAGRIDANTVYVGNQSLGPSTSSAANLGFVNVNGTATLVVNSNLVLGRTTVNSVAATKTAGTLNINGGTVCANAISVGTFSTNNVILMTNATLVISNAIGAPGYGITRFAISNSVLQLNITGITNAFMTNLITGGTTNMITIGSAAILPSYPAQVTLVKYVGAIGGAGFNFGLNPLPPTAIGFLSNNTANSSIDLVLTTDPRPLITVQPQGAAVNPAEPVTLTVIATGAPTLGYQWLQSGTNVVDGDNISGSASSSLMIASADPTNNGNYTVIVTNAYGSLTSSIAIVYVSASDVAPFISQDPQSQTVLLGQSAMFTVSGAAKPLPTYQWLKAGSVISGATNSSYSIGSAQLTDEAGYSVILSNSVNSITSIVANLTVNIAPVITNQPVSTAVLNSASASFSVVAGGKPVPTYQWYKNNNPITDATNATLPFGSVAPSDAGTYFVVASSSAGSIQSTNVTLIVNSAMAVTGLFPANISSGICADTPLRITFDSAPTIGTTGRIRIFNAANTTTPVDTIDLSLSTGGGTQPRVIAGAAYNTYPVIISGNTANIYPHLGVITTNQTYYVTIENVVNGSFKDSAGATFTGVNATNVWRFTTKPATPANATNIVVAADGSGDFCTVQGAVDFAPSGNTTPRTINLRVGTYTEVVFINGKNNLNFIGQNRDQTIVTYANNDNLNGGTSARPSFRAAGNDLTFANLTLTNSTPKGGSQAEALRTDGKRILLLGVKLASFQDTILVNNNGDLVYVQDSLIQGDTDFIWGGSTLFVTNSEIRTLTGGTQVTQARTMAGTNGFSFVGCRLTRTDNTVINCGLGRDLGFFDNNVAFINCLIDDHITSWQNADPRDWEFGNSNLTATAAVTYNGVQLAATNPNLTNAQTASLWLYGWSPAYAPLITSQPAPQTVAANSSASFTVGALGVSTPTYQWQKNSTNLVGQTGATLTINNASGNDIGSYSVIVSNAAGTVTSTAALLNVNPPAAGPVLNATALLGNGDIQFSIGGAPGSAGFSYRVWASTNVALSPVTSTWTLLTNDTFSGSPILFTDPQGGVFPQRFYIITVP